MSAYTRLFFLVALFLHTTVSASEFGFSRSEPCPTEDLFPKAREMALSIPVVHSNNIISYVETRIHTKGTSPRRKQDYAMRTIPVVFLNTMTCELQSATLVRTIINGRLPTMLSTDDGKFIVFVEPRPYGTLWNWWNTPLQVLAPEGWVIAAIHWKRIPSGESVAYTPGSADLMNSFPTLAELGRYHIRDDILLAYSLLTESRSRAFPDLTIEKVFETYFPRLLESIISIEHADDHEVMVFRNGGYAINPIDRPFAVIGANPLEAYGATTSSAGARGLMQVMPKTCREIRTLYVSKIPAGCYEDPHGHPAELASAMLVIDYHLSILMDRLRKPSESREAFAQRPEAKLMIRAAYNTGPGRVSKAVRSKRDWAANLLMETRGYLVKAFGLD